MGSAVRTAGNYAFHNAGALTTTWSAPSGCPTGQSIYTGIGNPNEEGILSKIFNSCPAEEWQPECWPNGEKVIEINESIKEEGQLPITFHAYINSPGFHCPDTWETVGVASFKDGSLDPSGVFASTSFRQLSYDSGDQETTFPTPTRNFDVNALTSVLAPTETAIVCCPSGFTAHPVNGCYSVTSLAALASQTLCLSYFGGFNLERTTVTDTFEYFGATITDTIRFAFPPTTGTAEAETVAYTVTMNEYGLPIETESFSGPTAPNPSLAAMDSAAFFILVNSGENDGDKNDGGEESAEESGTGSGSGESAAHSLRPVTSWIAGAVVLCWTAGFVIGGGI